jgi:hypothetical protein
MKATKILDVKFVRCYLKPLLEGTAVKIPEKIKSVGFVSTAWQCQQHKRSAIINSIIFTKNRWLEKAQNVLYSLTAIFWITLGPEHYLCYQAQALPSGWDGSRPMPVQTSTMVKRFSTCSCSYVTVCRYLSQCSVNSKQLCNV